MNKEDWQWLDSIGWRGEHHALAVQPIEEVPSYFHVKNEIKPLCFLVLKKPLSKMTLQEKDTFKHKKLEIMEKIWIENEKDAHFQKNHSLFLLASWSYSYAFPEGFVFCLKKYTEKGLALTETDLNQNPWNLLWQTSSFMLLKKVCESFSKEILEMIFKGEWIKEKDPNDLSPLNTWLGYWPNIKTSGIYEQELLESVQLFLKNGVDPMKPWGERGENIYHILASSNLNVVRSLLEFLDQLHLNPNIPSKTGHTPLMELVVYGKDERLIDWWVSHGADINQKNTEGLTPLMLLATHAPMQDEFASKCLKKMFKYNVDLTLQNHQGQTIFDFKLEDAPLFQKTFLEELHKKEKEKLETELPKAPLSRKVKSKI